MKNIELRELVLDLGIFSNIQGYHFILESYNIISKQKIHTSMTTVYRTIGKKFGKNCSSVERAIRHSIQKCWKYGNLNKIYNQLPDNSVFLYDLYFNLDIIKNKLKKENKQ